MEENKLEEIENELAYDEAWIIEAKKMITTTRYKNMPARHLEHYDFSMDNDFDKDDGCDCDEDYC